MRTTTTASGRDGRGTGRPPLALVGDPVLMLLDEARGWVADDPRAALSSVLKIVGLLRDRCASSTVVLSPAERRVVMFAAEGVPNREIAENLYLSVRTVESHLSHAYVKLGVRTKAELAARWTIEDAS